MRIMTFAGRAIAVVAGLLMVVAGATATAGAAPVPGGPSTTTYLTAGEDVMSIQASPPVGCLGIATIWGVTCFAAVGDAQWVRDLDPNDYEIFVHLETNYGKERVCDGQATSLGWKKCEYDHRENTCVRFYMKEKLGNVDGRRTGWSSWINTASGNYC